ncbi:flagellar hook-associated protein FlgL [Desulforamulus putei]|uniref:Flagellar hook-associated protein 3 FlgL n=1 Tax=Desulforamulus putei DSM 12395 TaxID=1121429 RepID=A0A1M5AY20_9FIRM|nr:flagellar hook-associated protein FlgL [Desulforamulus putei]SHF34977.1 flagellar hook-associated protein 3 FlgL [Desulforamulus putei DSM 12395]
MLRVSNTLLANNMCRYIQNNLQRSAKTQEHSATGKTINRPSDNPSEISHLMAINATLMGNEQYLRNIQDGLGYLNQSDTALDTVGKTLQDAKVLALQGANDTLTQEDRQAIAEQIDKQIDALVDLANSSLGGKYLFAGTQNGMPPFMRKDDKIYYRGNTDLVQREILFGSSYAVVAPGVEDAGSANNGVFGKLTANTIEDPPGSGQIWTEVSGGPLDVLKNLRDQLRAGDTAGINAALGQLDTAHDEILTHRVAVGARTRHLEAVQEQLADQETKLKERLVDIQGADIAKLTIEAAENQLVHQASLMTAANLLNVSLLQYLK